MGILDSLQAEMETLEDKEKHDGYWYRISDVLVMMVCGMLCFQERIDDIQEWATSAPTRKFLAEQFGITRIPSRAQFYNILKCVSAEAFNRSFIRWMQSILQSGAAEKTIAIDGKTVCGTGKLTDDGSVLHIASALISEYNLVIGSLECGTKTGEKTTFRELLTLLDVSGAIVVADALHCSKTSAEAVIVSGADYLLVVKDNVPTLKADIEMYIHNEEIPSHTTLEKNGGRIEKRTAYATEEISWLDGKEKWKNLSTIGAIHREFQKGNEISSEWHYYISSAPLSPEALLRHARLEWGVESMHWLLDVHFSEDKTRVWDMNVQKILNTTRKIVLNLTRIYKSENSPKRTALSDLLKRNLFDLNHLTNFLQFFRQRGKLD